MTAFEYKVVPAPHQGRKGKGLKTTGERFAHALEGLMNELGAQGWDYVRADTLPCEERTGLTGRTTTFQNVLVFKRPKNAANREAAPPAGTATLLLEAPEAPADPGEAAGPAQPEAPKRRATPFAGLRRGPLSAPNPAPLRAPTGVPAAPTPAGPAAQTSAEAPQGGDGAPGPEPARAARAAAAALRTYQAGGPTAGGRSGPPSGPPSGPESEEAEDGSDVAAR